MQAVQFNLKENKLEFTTNKKVPDLGESDVLIKVAFAGICGTDLHIIQGEFPCNEQQTFTLGHEFSGTIAAKGRKVFDFSLGDKVAVDPNNCCKCCKFCHVGRVTYCKRGGIKNTLGIIRDGGWAQYVSVPYDQVHKIPENINLKQAVLLEPLSCIVNGWEKLSPIPLGSKILLLGAGIIGNLFASVLHVHGHKDVTVSEPIENRRNLLKNLNTRFECVSPNVLKNKKVYYDVVIDTTGNASAVENSLTSISQGGKICLFGCTSPRVKISVPAFEMVAKEIQMFGVFLNALSFPKAIDLMNVMGDRYIDYEKLGIKTYELSDYKEALNGLRNGEVSKAVFELVSE